MARLLEVHAGASADQMSALVADMRQADRDECAAAGALDLDGAVRGGVRTSALCWTATVDGEVAAIFGVVPVSLLGDDGVVWMLGTPLVARNARSLMRIFRPYLGLMLKAYPHLLNYVHARNRTALGWLRRTGFTLGAPVAAATGEMFYPFEMRA